MSFDKIRTTDGTKVPEEEGFADDVEALLDRFPPQNRDKLVSRITGRTYDEQKEILEMSWKLRKEAIARPRYESPRLRSDGRISDAAFDSFKEGPKQVEVGRGDNGRVFEYVPPKDTGRSTVFKILIRVPLPHQNDLLSEGAYQADVAAFAAEHPELRVGVPTPFYAATSSKGHILAMEKLPGYSLRDIAEKNIRLSADFDYDLVERSLQQFVEQMNAAGFYHRDLREGNIMLDPHTDETKPLAYIIDFGFCTHAQDIEHAYKEVDGIRDHVMIKKVMAQLRAHQEMIEPQEASL